MPAKLKINLAEVKLLAHALNCSKPILHFSDKQRAALPALGRKLANFIAEPDYRANPKPAKKSQQFRPLAMENRLDNMQAIYATL